uniref:DUF7775 domain-containing protein n=1 Tax=Timema bartmani TaxID=61472 RepID=A0A7R9F188_9NEOP|nr:unnamed protein product [Timema bartmani]
MAIPKTSILKFVELALTITCLGMHYKDHGPVYSTDLLVVTGTFGGYLIILIGVFAGLVTGQPINKRIDLFYSLAGCALFVASGALIIQYYDKGYSSKSVRDLGLAKGSLSIINGAVFLLDTFFTFRNE